MKQRLLGKTQNNCRWSDDRLNWSQTRLKASDASFVYYSQHAKGNNNEFLYKIHTSPGEKNVNEEKKKRGVTQQLISARTAVTFTFVFLLPISRYHLLRLPITVSLQHVVTNSSSSSDMNQSDLFSSNNSHISSLFMKFKEFIREP